MQDGRTFEGRVLSFDSVADLALVKVGELSLGGNNQRVKAMGKNCLHVYYRGAYSPCSATLSAHFSVGG
jgi:hypothetical protein